MRQGYIRFIDLYLTWSQSIDSVQIMLTNEQNDLGVIGTSVLLSFWAWANSTKFDKFERILVPKSSA